PILGCRGTRARRWCPRRVAHRGGNTQSTDGMRSGTIELTSGRWDWTLLPQWAGSTVVFQHRNRILDEMRNWIPDREVTPEQVQELALDPLERVWTDVDGLRWRISMELPTRWRREVRAAGEQNGEWMWLVFRRGGVRQLVSVPAITHL